MTRPRLSLTLKICPDLSVAHSSSIRAVLADGILAPETTTTRTEKKRLKFYSTRTTKRPIVGPIFAALRNGTHFCRNLSFV